MTNKKAKPKNLILLNLYHQKGIVNCLNNYTILFYLHIINDVMHTLTVCISEKEKHNWKLSFRVIKG